MVDIISALQAAAGQAGGEALAIEDVFSTYLYTGNNTTQTIDNGIDLNGEGGLMWVKARNNAYDNMLFDTERGVGKYLFSNLTNPEGDFGGSFGLYANTSGTGFIVNGSGNAYNDADTPTNYASWTFRKAPRFFDVVTYTGTSADQTINHSLDADVGAIFIKSLDSARYWWCTHRRLNNGTNWWQYDIHLNDTLVESTETFYAFMSEPTSTSFTLRGGKSETNANGERYVAYLFAHDPLGPSGDGSDGLIACGSYTGNGSADGPEIDLGWEPQFIMTKAATRSSDWMMFDVMRGIVTGGTDAEIKASSSNIETSSSDNYLNVTSTGFKLALNAFQTNNAGQTYIYIAIRRGPMRQPESGTEVFAMDVAGSTAPSPPYYNAPFPVDMGINKIQAGSDTFNGARLISGNALRMNLTNAETATSAYDYDYQDGWINASTLDADRYSWMWRRAPGFFDVVAYTGTGVARTVPHNLGVAPELMVSRRRDASAGWSVYSSALGATQFLRLHNDGVPSISSSLWNDTAPSATEFTVGSTQSATGGSYIQYLFATLPGVSKVGSYTGNGTSQTIDCGFTSGARFILIKRTDSTGDWYVWDTERGIVAANDPHLSLNTTAAEVTTDDSVDPDSSGFIVNQVAATNINVSSASYIFYAVS